jgi:hypothetical protein
MNRPILFALLLFLTCPLTTLAESAWQQHGSLTVSADGHRLQHADGTPFLWMGDTGWGMFQQLTREAQPSHGIGRKEVVRLPEVFLPRGRV